MERLSKFLGRAGVCSRRQAEVYITSGRVRVNGDIIKVLGTLVSEGDQIQVDGVLIGPPSKTRVWLYYKPVGLIVSHKDPEGRTTVFDDLQQKGLPRVVSIGRLDLNSEGILLLTNDGEFSRKAELPSTGWKRVYKVRVFGSLNEKIIEPLRQGCTIEGIHYKPVDIALPDSIAAGLKNHWILITLQEGKNREIRKLMEHVGLQVNRLIRLAYGPFELGSMKPGDVKEAPAKILKNIF